MLDLSKRSKNLFVILPSANNLQINRHTSKLLGVILVVYESIFVVLRDILDILGVFERINRGYRENCCWAAVLLVSYWSLKLIDLLVQKVPVSGISPVTRLFVRRCRSEIRWT
jgi:hypothetical protein